jgi:hypothetical protein
MTPKELSKNIQDTEAIFAAMSDGRSDATPEETDLTTDFWEALDLLKEAQEQMELLVKLDLDLKFLTNLERRNMLYQTADIMTFVAKYREEEEEEEDDSEDETYEED